MNFMNSLPYTPRVKRSLALAHQIATKNGDGYVGLEHLLLAILSFDEGPAFKLIEACNISPKEFRDKATAAFDSESFAATDTAKMADLNPISEVAALLRKAADALENQRAP
jgi:ATP-dependent Clp protease ATP-binding subunit ClpC